MDSQVRLWLLANFDTLIPYEIVMALRKFSEDAEL